VQQAARSIAIRIAWVACAALVAFGTAGIVTAMENAPGTPARAELTWAADRRIAPGLQAAADDLRRLAANVDGLSSLGTNALAAVNGGDTGAIQAAIADGDTLIETIAGQTIALRASLASLPGVGPAAEGRLGELVRSQYQTLVGALDATVGLGDSWDRLTAGSLSAVRLQTTLADHDAATLAAAKLGTEARYADAITQLDTSDAALTAARQQRDIMSGAVDVSVLTQWIDRNADYDASLRKLYGLLVQSRGKVTAAVKSAFAAQETAKALLPVDTRALIVIMSDIARGGLNQAVISIEDARGRMTSSIDAFTQRGGPGASGGPRLPAQPGASGQPSPASPAAP
jgi:hypothetical protein